MRGRAVLGAIGLLIFSFAAGADSHAPKQDPAEIQLEREVRFEARGGERVAVAAGTWRVETIGDEALRLVPEDGRVSSIRARAASHQEELAGPVAISVVAEGDTQHVLLLLPDGTGLEAVGSAGTVATRGLATLGPEPLKERVAARGLPRATSRAASYTRAGRSFFTRRTEWGHRKAIRYYQAALKTDPRYAPAHSGMADAYALLHLHVEPKPESLAQAVKSAARAVQLAPSSSATHASLGWTKNI